MNHVKDNLHILMRLTSPLQTVTTYAINSSADPNLVLRLTSLDSSDDLTSGDRSDLRCAVRFFSSVLTKPYGALDLFRGFKSTSFSSINGDGSFTWLSIICWVTILFLASLPSSESGPFSIASFFTVLQSLLIRRSAGPDKGLVGDLILDDTPTSVHNLNVYLCVTTLPLCLNEIV